MSSKHKKNAAIPWRIGFAVTAAAAVVLSVIFIPKAKTPTTTVKDTDRAYLAPAQNYDDIYESFYTLKKSREPNFWEYVDDFLDFGSDLKGNGIATEEEFITDESENESTTDINGSNDYSDTTTQVEGVAEADIVKTDGKYIYALAQNRVQIIEADGEKTQKINTLMLDEGYHYNDMYLSGDRLVLVRINNNYGYKESSELIIFDVKNPKDIKTVGVCSQSGSHNSTRMIGSTVYMLSNYYINLSNIKKSEPETFIPYVECTDGSRLVGADSIMMYENDLKDSVYLTVCAYDAKDATLISSRSLLGGADEMYCSTQNIITANRRSTYDGQSGTTYSQVSRFKLNDGKIEYITSAEISGTLLNQFSIDEYKGNFRFVTTTDESETKSDGFSTSYTSTSYTNLVILDGNLKPLGKIERLAEGERVYSVRFMGDIAYFVTFRQVDPLFSADLSDPQNPKILGKLKIPGFSNYLYPYGEGKLLGIGQDADENTGRTGYMKLSMFDTANPDDVFESDNKIIRGCTYSPALYNHKATLVSVDKNLIGFLAMDDMGYNTYLLYAFENGEFVLKAEFDAGNDYKYSPEYTRGLFIEDCFYIVSYDSVSVYSLNGFEKLNSTDLVD